MNVRKYLGVVSVKSVTVEWPFLTQYFNMELYKLNNNKLSPVDQKSFDLEKDIQSLVENNLETLFNLEFVSTEFNMKFTRSMMSNISIFPSAFTSYIVSQE